MRLFGDRFLIDDENAVDLATAERVRLTIDEAPARAVIRDRETVCSGLAGIRHPLLIPIVDFGLAEGQWFEAHTPTTALRSGRDESRGAALHLVRFMHAEGVILSNTGGPKFFVAILEVAGQFVEYFRFSFRLKMQSSEAFFDL